MVMVHGDNKGLIVPPRVVSFQVCTIMHCVCVLLESLSLSLPLSLSPSLPPSLSPSLPRSLTPSLPLSLSLCSLCQVVVVPCGITASMDEQSHKDLIGYCESFISSLTSAGVRVHGDFRDNYSPGWKFYHWEQKVCVWMTLS